MGVFATRSTFRPNPLGMSLIELKGVRVKNGEVVLELGSLDLVDGTPVVDIKPYLPFAESQPQAAPALLRPRPPAICRYVSRRRRAAAAATSGTLPAIKAFYQPGAGTRPRPAYRKGEDVERDYAVWLLDFNVRWRVVDGHTEVLALDPR